MILTHCVQEMLYVKKIIESTGLQVELQMIIHVDNKGAKDLMNNWSTGGLTKHIYTCYFRIRELKEENILKVD